MPRINGIMQPIPGSYGVPNTPIESAKYNAQLDDLIADANNARPVTAGGTGAQTAVAGSDNLSTVGTAMPSYATTNLGAANGANVTITGTTTITEFGTAQAGAKRWLTFAGALTLTHDGTKLILPGAADIVTAAGDTCVVVSLGTGNWRLISYQRSSGKATTPATAAELLTAIKTVDGEDSGLDADLLDGEHGAFYLDRENHTGTVPLDETTGELPFNATNELLRFPLAGGTANDLTLTPAVPMTAYADGDVLTFEASADNTGAATANVSGVGAKAVRKIVAGADVDLAASDILAGQRYFLNYDSDANSAAGAFILVNPGTQPIASVTGLQAALDAKTIQSGSLVATTSGSAIDLTGIPVGVKRVTLSLLDVSTNGTSVVLVQLGTAGGIQNTGYVGVTSINGSSLSAFPATGPYLLSGAANALRTGCLTFTRANPATDTWTITGEVSDRANNSVQVMSGYKALGAALDRIRLMPTNGTDAFDGGSVLVNWEF